jgi:hypothetical protein
LIVCGDFNLDVSGNELKDKVRSKGFEIHPREQERDPRVDFALVREHRVNVLSCEPQNPSASLTKQRHYGDVKGIAQKNIDLSCVKDEVIGDINQEKASVCIKAESIEEACEGECATLPQIGLLNSFQLLNVVDSPLNSNGVQANFDHDFFHLVVAVNCVLTPVKLHF